MASLQQRRNKPKGLVAKRGKYYCRIVSSDVIDVLIPLQTSKELEAYSRCRQINVYRKFIVDGELSVEELTNVSEIAEWFNHSKSKIAPLTIGALSKRWLKVKSVELATTTIKHNTKNINTVINIIGDKNVKDLSIDDIDKFKVARNGQVCEHSINRELIIFKAFCNWLYDGSYIARPLKIKLIKVIAEPRPKYITENQFRELLVNGDMPSIVIDACKVYWFTGCRKTELVEGKLRGHRLIIDSSISKSGREFSYYVPQSFIPFIKNIHQARDEFIKKYKLKSFADYISKQVIKAYKRIGIYEKNRTKLHSLRHSFGCRMYLITADIKEVGKKMNHKDRTSTEQYVGYTQDLLEDFPSDAPYSAFRNNMERVERANEDILKYLNPQVGTQKREQIEFQEGASTHS
jgi:integrase